MNHQSFRSAFEAALRLSGLQTFGVGGHDLLDLQHLDRIHRVAVEPSGGQDTEPFLVTASLSWRWSALQTARANTTEEDVVTELLGRGDEVGIRTERPWIRVDIALKATLPHGMPMVMPGPKALRAWCRATTSRIELIESPTSEAQVPDRDDGRLLVLAWQQEEPRVYAVCRSSGELMLDGVELAAWQGIEVPRILDDPDHEPDPEPAEALAAMFGRIRVALSAWTQALDHLRG
jgi:hypothetical protein